MEGEYAAQGLRGGEMEKVSKAPKGDGRKNCSTTGLYETPAKDGSNFGNAAGPKTEAAEQKGGGRAILGWSKMGGGPESWSLS